MLPGLQPASQVLGATRATAKPIKAPPLEKEPKPQLSPDAGSKAPPPVSPRTYCQATTSPLGRKTRSSAGCGSRRDQTMVPRSAHGDRARGRKAAGAGWGGECKETWVLSGTSSARRSGTPSPLQPLRRYAGAVWSTAALAPAASTGHQIMESLKWEKTSKIVKSNRVLGDARKGDLAAGSPRC